MLTADTAVYDQPPPPPAATNPAVTSDMRHEEIDDDFLLDDELQATQDEIENGEALLSASPPPEATSFDNVIPVDKLRNGCAKAQSMLSWLGGETKKKVETAQNSDMFKTAMASCSKARETVVAQSCANYAGKVAAAGAWLGEETSRGLTEGWRKTKPYVDNASEKTSRTFTEGWQKSKPYVEGATEKTSQTLSEGWKKTKINVESALEKIEGRIGSSSSGEVQE